MEITIHNPSGYTVIRGRAAIEFLNGDFKKKLQELRNLVNADREEAAAQALRPTVTR